MNWNNTHKYCQQRGMQMAMLKTPYEVQQVAEQLKQRKLDGKFLELPKTRNEIFNNFPCSADKYGSWVSATDVGQTPPGKFQWADGTPVEKSSWLAGQPDHIGLSSSKEFCAYFHALDSKLRDWTCSDPAHTLCVVPVTQCACTAPRA